MENRKPREFWFVPDPSNTWRNKPNYEIEGLVHIREVLPQEPDYKKLAADLAEALAEMLKSHNLDDVEYRNIRESIATYRAALEKYK